jgi:sugar/nucleoside kinase (ribokinase family)
VSVVAVVGEDFPEAHVELLRARGIGTEGLVRTAGRTFRWKGAYSYNLNEAKTLATELNVFETFRPELPASYRDASHVFLANIDPGLQLGVLEQVRAPKLVVLDTMNFWISGRLDDLRKVLRRVDVLVANDGEARQLTGEPNLMKAARRVLELGPTVVVVKKGEHGALLVTREFVFTAPAYPVEFVFDPTGAGDTFAGGFVGWLAKSGETSERTLRQAVIYGTVMASFTVEKFSLDRLKDVTDSDISLRYKEIKTMSDFALE